MGRNVRAEESRAEMVLGRGVPEPFTGAMRNVRGRAMLLDSTVSKLVDIISMMFIKREIIFTSINSLQ